MKAKTKTKALLMSLCAVLLVAASVLGTMAYLTDSKDVKNTFTVGNVSIKLDEAKVNADGKAIDKKGNVVTDFAKAERVAENSYKLLPGHTYVKDPTVTVLKPSVESYVKMTVTFTKADALDAIFAPTGGAELANIFGGYDAATWLYKGNTKEGDTRTYEFWYKTTVDATGAAQTLKPLFTSIIVPGTINNDQLKSIDGMTINVNAYAIQADGFKNADAAWAAFAAQN